MNTIGDTAKGGEQNWLRSQDQSSPLVQPFGAGNGTSGGRIYGNGEMDAEMIPGEVHVQHTITKRKKVMLVLPNHHWATADENYTMWLVHPTQICLLAGQIEDKYDVKIVDCIIDDVSEAEFEEIVRREKPDVVGMSNFTHEYSKAGHKGVSIAKKVNQNIITFMGGVYVITSPELAIANPDLDYAVIGEGELIIQDLLAHLYDGASRPQKGLAFRDQENGQVIVQPRADFIQNLDLLKYPAYHLVNFLKYATRYQRESPARPRALPFARVCMTRGCPIGCTFCCVESISGGPTRYRSAQHMLGELEMLKNKYGVKCIFFDDDNLFMNRNKAKELLRGMIERKLDLAWLDEATAIFCMDEETVDLCAQSGCKYLNFAIESGSSRVVKDIVKKPIHYPRVIELVKRLRSYDIALSANFVIGNPGETWDEIMESVRFAEELDKYDVYSKFFICTPFPKTKMFETAKAMGYLDDSIKFDEHHWTGGTFNTPHWRAKDLAIARAYFWDKVNFSRPEKKKMIAEWMGISLERLDEIRRATREKANPDEHVDKTLKTNRFLTTKEKSVEQALHEVIPLHEAIQIEQVNLMGSTVENPLSIAAPLSTLA